MKRKIYLLVLSVTAGFMSACTFLDPLPNGSYNDENFELYPELLRGFVDVVYNELLPETYLDNYYIPMSCATDDAIYSSPTAAWRIFSSGSAKMSSNPFDTKWRDNYRAINYLNMFLENDRGYNTRYMVAEDSDLALRNCLQGSAYGLRAWMYFDLLRVFGGKAENGELLGVPILTEPTDPKTADASTIERATFDECAEQILKDCDSAYKYLPRNNRDYPGDPQQSIQITGSARYKSLDQIAIDGLRAMVYIFWASPAYNPENDMSRYDKAARYAAAVIKHKLEVESTLTGGFDPTRGFSWHNVNSPEIIWPSEMRQSSNLETSFYPQQFGGSALVAPTQDLVDAFPMANGYPINDKRSNYDPTHPYEGRDPRFYATIFYNGAQVRRLNNASEVMYTFECANGGKDAPGSNEVSATGYYIKKFIYRNWNTNDTTKELGYRCIHFMNWTKMCLIFAEAANKYVGPTDEGTYGYSARQAIAWLRNRPTNDDEPGLGTFGDPYLDECAAEATTFEGLVKNEWRVETCFEGDRYYNLRRWATDVSEINKPIHMAKISNQSGLISYEYPVVETLKYPSLWAPIPYTEIRKCPKLLQNQGWETWK
ncbi:RagB/SusD family nutrient uptake outer membrane protein [Alistipes shahii]|uniref:RagB/SusD family nutrient uptake outer membrane protein n=1 Tax=Alistipes shahii TaxID=328814 RepID=UPI002096C8E4|nr:RagB/SusD family nutrient uptake outer membrane protein [Alistipes shahii]MCO7107241.1 RagB/SusD family nutrient uptake outer membrane protein [Alistipes shahii]